MSCVSQGRCVNTSGGSSRIVSVLAVSYHDRSTIWGSNVSKCVTDDTCSPGAYTNTEPWVGVARPVKRLKRQPDLTDGYCSTQRLYPVRCKDIASVSCPVVFTVFATLTHSYFDNLWGPSVGT